ncbi:MAG: PAS domain S-box protein, partial [Ignavibacteriales bacterium]
NNCINNAEPYDLVSSFITCKGKNLWVRTIAKPIIENNVIVKIIGNIADVTRERRAELLSEARYRLIEYSYHSKLDEFLQKVLDEAENLTRSKIGFYHFVEADQITLSLQAWSTNTVQHMCKAEGKGLHYDIDKAGVWVDCVHKQKTIVHNDYESLTHKKGLPEGHAAVIREVVVPVFREDKIVAILGVGNKSNFYDDDDVQMITRLADLAWDITERKRSEKALDQSELKYKRIIETSNEGIWMMDADYNTTYVNKRMANQLEYAVEEMIGKKVYDFMFEEDLVDHRKKMDSRKKGLEEIYERRFKKKSGDELWTMVSATAILSDDKKFLGSFAMFTDITDRKNSEHALMESEEKYRLLFDASPIGIGIADMNGKIINSNPVMKQITGYDFENEKDVTVTDMYLHKENRETLLNLLSKNGCTRDWEVDLKRKDGSIYNALLNVDLIQIGNQKFILTNMRDISNRIRAEKILKENEELKQTVLDSLNANVAVVDSKGNIISVNKPWEKFALSNGIKKLDGTVEKINYFDVLCKSVESGEKSADKVFEGIKSVLKGELPFYETEYPCDSPSEKRWFVMHVLPLVNESGVVISHENITERKIAEDQLRQSEERLKLLNIVQQDQNAELVEKNTELKKARLSTLNIIEDLSREIREHKLAEEKLKANEQKFKTVADFTYDWEYWEGKNNEIIYMSPSCQRITGYSREDFITNPSLLERIVAPDDVSKFITHHQHIVDYGERDKVEELEFRIIHKNGSLINLYHICRPIFDENKKYLGRRVSNRDISEKKQIEIELRNSEAKYHELYSLLRLMSDTMPDMLWAKDLDKKYLFANKAICENLLMAKNTEEPIGKTDLYFAERQRRLHSENPQWHTFGELCQDSDLITLKEMKHKQFDEFGNVKGKFLYLDVHKAPLINDNGELLGTVGSARDITEPKAAEKALKESESRNRAFLNAIPDLIFILSQDGIFIDYKSEREEELLLPPQNFIGKHLRDV